MKTHKDLDIWKEGIQLVLLVYEITRQFPKEEQFILTFQMRKAAVSVPSNIAEGAARNSNAQYIQFVNIALASLAELETQSIMSNLLGYCEEKVLLDPIEAQRRKMLNFIKYLESKP
ncbi:MAG: four helix bundle protein [Bacteroidia bacterium]|nr:four helix bundle protein [Bacteroidia bacterium]